MPVDDMFILSVSPEKAPDKPTYVEITFEAGIPIALDGKKMDGVSLVSKLNEIGGKNGVGRIDIVENRLVGIKSRGVYETPGGTILMLAHKDLESITLERETAHYKEAVAIKYAEMIYNGQWFSPLKESLDKFIDETQKYVNGTVRLKLYKGNCMAVGRKSSESLYDQSLATFEEEDVYDQKDAEGFIRLNALRLKIRAQKRKASS